MVKAVVMSRPGEVALREFELPEVTQGMLLDVDFCGICGSDIGIFDGRFDCPFPIIPGHEIVGTIAEIEKQTDRIDANGESIMEGDKVAMVPDINCGKCYFCKNIPGRDNLCQNRISYGITISCRDFPHLFGGWSEKVYVKPEAQLFKIPQGLDLELAVLIEPLASATRAVERAYQPGMPFEGEGFAMGSTIVIQGAGPIGLLTLVAAKTAGAGKIIVLEGVDERMKMAEDMGAYKVLDLKTTVQERYEEIMQITKGIGVDAVFECAGVPAAVEEGISLVRRGGKYIELGHGTDHGYAKLNPQKLCYKDFDISTVWGFPARQYNKALAVLDLQEDIGPLRKLVSHKFPLERVNDALQIMKNGKCFKIAVSP